MQYVATINVPGYLPMDDEPPTFDTAQEAWQYLLEERERSEEDCNYGDVTGVDGHNGEFTCAMSPTYHELERWTVAPQAGFPTADWTGTVYGDTPGYEGDHDLGLAYSVTIVEEGD